MGVARLLLVHNAQLDNVISISNSLRPIPTHKDGYKGDRASA